MICDGRAVSLGEDFSAGKESPDAIHAKIKKYKTKPNNPFK
jgi:hypothetical protein